MSKNYKGPVSNHYNGNTFSNLNQVNVDKSISDLLKWTLFEDTTPFPKYFDSNISTPTKSPIASNKIIVTYINHATILIQTENLNILTDPVWSKRVSPFSWLGPKRVTNPGVKFEDLPPIDIVLISHNHFDHMDIDTLKKLSKKHNPIFLMGLGNNTYLKDKGIDTGQELDWDESHQHKTATFTFVPVQHWSKRTLTDTNKSLWGGFVIETPQHKIYFAGDTGYANHFKSAQIKFHQFDLALLPIGAYEPRWFMKEQHMNPEESVQAHIDLNSRFSIGIHFGVFQLTNEGIDQPVIDLKAALLKNKLPPDSFIAPKIGESFEIVSKP